MYKGFLGSWGIWAQPLCALFFTIRVGQNHIFIRIYGVHTVFLAGNSPYIRSYTVQIYGSGQPYIFDMPAPLAAYRADALLALPHIARVGQNHIYTVYIRYFWHGNHQIYGLIRHIYIRCWHYLTLPKTTLFDLVRWYTYLIWYTDITIWSGTLI